MPAWSMFLLVVVVALCTASLEHACQTSQCQVGVDRCHHLDHQNPRNPYVCATACCMPHVELHCHGGKLCRTSDDRLSVIVGVTPKALEGDCIWHSVC